MTSALPTVPSMDSAETPADLEGQPIGPVDIAVTSERVALYVETTGDVPGRWSHEAPPGFGSVLLFAVADKFLYHPRMVKFTATLLHLDQSFRYVAPLRIGSTVTVGGTVVRVRERSGSFFVTFEAVASDGDGVVMEFRSTFVLSDQSAPRPEQIIQEPPVRDRATNSGMQRSASRYDLVRYAAATRDFNPLHWDHDFAVGSGLSGIVVHGLLMYAWLTQEASNAAGGRSIVASKVRFRDALFPAEQAQISATVDGDSVNMALACRDVRLVTGTFTVVRDSE